MTQFWLGFISGVASTIVLTSVYFWLFETVADTFRPSSNTNITH